MKRTIAGILSLTTILSLAACGGGAASSGAASPAASNAASGAASSAASSAAAGEDVKTYVVGTRGTVAAYTYVDENNNLTGYDIEVLRAIDERLPDVAFEFQTMDLSACFVALEAGQIDLIANQMVHNEERDSKYYFSEIPYGYAVSRLVVRGDVNDITTLDDLKGKTIAVTPTSEAARVIQKFNETADPQIIIKNFDGGSAETNVQVATGQADATSGYKASSEAAAEQNGYDIKVVGEPIAATPVYFILRQDEEAAALIEKIDATLQELIDDGTISALSQEFLGEDVLESIP